VGSKLNENFDDIVKTLRTFPALLEEDQSVDIDNEIGEASLIAIGNLVRKCPHEAKSHVSKLFELTSSCIQYDPNYNDLGDDEDAHMNDYEEEDGGGWDSDYYNENQDDDDDTAWKVRKSSVKIVDAIITACPQTLQE